MNWTKEKPKVDGYYWLKRKGMDKKIVNIWDAPNDSMVAFCGSDMDKSVEDLRGAEWYGPLGLPEEEGIPIFQTRLAGEPIDSLYWRDSLGEEYKWIEGRGWLVTNETIGPYRIRNICKIIKTVKVEPEESPHG